MSDQSNPMVSKENFSPTSQTEQQGTVDQPVYHSAQHRTPNKLPMDLNATSLELSSPVFGHSSIRPEDADLTKQHVGQPLGERIIVGGRLLDETGHPASGSLVEIWQTNSAGRYIHKADQHDAPLDPNFTGAGRTITDEDGWYRFVTVKPGAYPWGNHPNAWRPAHIHFSLFGPSYLSRLVTQMYFPGDPLLPFDPIFQGVQDASTRALLVAKLDFNLTEEGQALGYRFDITVRGRKQTPIET